MMRGAGVGCDALVDVEQLLGELLPGRAPVISIAMSRSGSRPERRIICRASSRIDTGSPISRTKTSPLDSPSEPARITSWTASGIVMKKRVMRSSVTVTGPPAAIWRRKIGTTEPEEPSTLPKRTVA